MGIRSLARRALPPRVRRFLREALREIPIRLRDAPADLRDLIQRERQEQPLPPPFLRRRVALTSAREEYVDVGRLVARHVVDRFTKWRDGSRAYPRWLDFACGAGRVARHLLTTPGVEALAGVDVDADAIAWAAAHLHHGEFQAIDPIPPLRFESGSFDVVIAVSVFSHFDEDAQLRWLEELRRVLRPGGLLIASTHSEHLTFGRPDLTVAQHQQLQARGFLFARGLDTFNEDSAFHSSAYLEATWGAFFRLREYAREGLAGFQDLSVWEAAER